MAIYSLIASTLSRAKGRSAIAAAAYRAGALLRDNRTNELFDYKRRKGVAASFIALPDHAPDWASNREQLWNEAESAEKRKNSTVAREFMIALPAELTAIQRKKLVKRFSSALVERYGFALDVAIHEPNRKGDERNHHAHLLASTRVLTAEGFKEKTRSLDGGQSGREEIEKIREMWANFANDALKKARLKERIDHRAHIDILAEKKDKAKKINARFVSYSSQFEASKNTFWEEQAIRIKKQLDRIYQDIARLLLPTQQHQGYFKTQLKRQEAERQAKELAARQEAERQAKELAARQEAERQAKERAARQVARQEAERQELLDYDIAAQEMSPEFIKEQEEAIAIWNKAQIELAPLRAAREKERLKQIEEQKAKKQEPEPEPEYYDWNNGPSM